MIPYSVTDKGAPSLTAEIVGRMIDDRVPYAEKWGEWSRVSNAASMWYEGYAEAMGTDGRLRTAFRQNGTRSSRFSVERVNLQAIPQDYRLSDYQALNGIPTPRQLIAAGVPDGWRIFELDLAQAELRVASMFANCKKMIEMIAENADLHTYTTRELFPHVPEDDPLFHAKWRQVGKRGNFSLCFGAGGPTFRKMISKETGIVLDDPEATRIVKEWNALYPEFSRAIDKHQNVVAKRQHRHGHGWVDFVNKERRWFQEYEEAHKAFNQRVQGNLGQFGIDWLLQTDPFLSNHLELQARAAKDGIGEPGLVLTIHDSQVLLLPDDDFGRSLAAQCAQFGKDLWKVMFPAIPGDVDYHDWTYEDAA
jgi:DNA polymerase I-like protein with 3'-5' exonuclease and polymerase domains